MEEELNECIEAPMNPKLSIIVPVYNVEKYIHKCVESILEQTFVDFELILVGGGSNDKSEEICEEYLLKDKRIKFINTEKNYGLSYNRNVGLDVAKGEFVAFVDSDDWISPKMYEILYEYSTKYNANIVQCNFIKTKTERVKYYTEVKKVIKCNSRKAIRLMNKESKYKVPSNIACSKLYRKEVFNKLRFPIGKLHEDIFTIYLAFYKSKNIIMLDIPLYYYRVRSSSITHKKYNVQRYDILEGFEQQLNFFKSRNDYELFSLVLEEYINQLIYHYKQTELYIKDNKKYKMYLKNKVRKVYFEYIKNKQISKQAKIKLSIFLISNKY